MAEKTEKKFPKGINYFERKPNAPDWVKGSLVISPNVLFEWIKANKDLITEHEKYGKQIRFTLTDKGLHVDTYNPTVNKAEPKEKNYNRAEPPASDFDSPLPF